MQQEEQEIYISQAEVNMGVFKTLVSGILALFVAVVVLNHSMALDVVLPTMEISSCDDLPAVYDGAGSIAIHVNGNITCNQHEVRSLLSCA